VTCSQNAQPGVESCNGLDDNCDGAVDNGNPGGGQACNTGLLGACSGGTTVCSSGAIACTQNVQATAEICDGLIDNNCNGQNDEGCNCVNGSTQSCYAGAAGTAGVGACHTGTQTCVNGNYGACVGQMIPAAETCDGVDNDCNGQVDDGLGTISCGVGQCGNTVAACVNGHVATCTPKAPSAEICDGLDNDCNGVIDNGSPGSGAACGTGKLGVCSAGTTACTAGAIVCNQTNAPGTETCDGLDNDCNGVVDNGNPSGGAACSTGQQGVCAAGTTACTGGAVVCTRNQAPSTETCDGLDNDCNGVVDNGNPSGGAACSTGQLGVCAAGTTACTGGAVLCTRNQGPSTEACDGLDNDCNGVIDNGNPGSGAACATGNLGICAAGTTTCTAGAITCTQTQTAKTETCNGLDDDCNGVVDNGNPGGGAACSTGQLGICAAGLTACTAGSLACNRTQGPATETCNGLDDDCNGTVDNGNPGGGVSCSTGQSGICSAGTTACVTGAVACNRNQSPIAEVCDGLDNNCNGAADDGVSCAAITATDTTWKQTQSPAAGWQNVGFDDSTWLAAVDEGQVPVAPWGAVAVPAGSLAHWIWSYDSRSGDDTQTVYFRKAFVPNAASMTLTITADNSFTAYVNGVQVGAGNSYPTAYTFPVTVTPGVTNVIAVVAVNAGGPGGLIADIRNADSASALVSTTAWKQIQNAPAGWQAYGFVDSSWLAAVDEGALPTAPWGAVPFPSGSTAHWIWSYDSRSGNDFQTVYFRRKFTATKASYTLYVTADNSFTAYVNGAQVGAGSNYPTAYSFPVTTVPGTGYALAISAVNGGGPGGLIVDLR
jgi:hypothetical protein